MQSHPKGKYKKFSAGETLFKENTPALGCFVIQSGSVGLSLICCDGHCAEVDRLGAGSLIGVSAGLANRKYVLTARALRDTEAIYIPHQQIVRSLRTHPEMRMLILRSLSRSVQQALRCLIATQSSANKKIFQVPVEEPGV